MGKRLGGICCYGVAIAVVGLISPPGRAGDLEELPVLDRAPFEGDFLVEEPAIDARVYRTADRRRIVMDNGLIRRVWQIEPNAACVAFDNLMTGQSMLRAVRPEAELRINGIPLNVGGITGQENLAFLTERQLAAMTADPTAMQFVGFSVGEPTERLTWTRARHHAPDVAWPPRGVTLRLDFKSPRRFPPVCYDLGGRQLLLDDPMEEAVEEAVEEAGGDWTIVANPADPDATFSADGKFGRIRSRPGTPIYAERALASGVRVVEVDVEPDATSHFWGAGIALVWPDRVVKFHLMPGSSSFGMYDGQKSRLLPGELKLGAAYTLRLQVEDDAVSMQAKGVHPLDGDWFEVYRLPLASPLGDPVAIRVGKMDPTAGAARVELRRHDAAVCQVSNVRAFGAPDPAAHEARTAPLRSLRVSVHYEIYDNVPVLCKWLTIHNESGEPIEVDRFCAEILAVPEYGGMGGRAGKGKTRNRVHRRPPEVLHVETDYAFGDRTPDGALRYSVHWGQDLQYSTQNSYQRLIPSLLRVEPTLGPDQMLPPGETFESFRCFELAHDSSDRERRGLALRRFYRTVAPWVTENPLSLLMMETDAETVRNAIDQCAECGFESINFLGLSSINMEHDDPESLRKSKTLNDYAEERGIELGGYTLLASRDVGRPDNVVSPPGDLPRFGSAPALTSNWGTSYGQSLKRFIETTGFAHFTQDGPYPGDYDVTPRPPIQRGLHDSQWGQWKITVDLYRWLRARGVYIQAPDYYYLNGQSKASMGYRESNWSLPRHEQVLITRQNIYDATWEKTPSMGWMMVPLIEYQGGGDAATIEPLHQHIDHYERMLTNNLGAGVQAHYLGNRLYDTPEVRDLVKRWVDFYKKYRDILESDVIHGRRADGRDIDWLLHVNPRLPQKGMLVVYNPLEAPVRRSLDVDVYYTGLDEQARVRHEGGDAQSLPVDRDHTIRVPVDVPAQGFTWYLIE